MPAFRWIWAKNKFSALVNAALAGAPQRVTRRGQPAVVVLAAEEYERLCLLEDGLVQARLDVPVARRFISSLRIISIAGQFRSPDPQRRVLEFLDGLLSPVVP